MNKLLKYIMPFIIALLLIIGLIIMGCGSYDNSTNSNTIVNIYSLDGELIASHSGEFIVINRSNGVEFLIDNTKYTYCNAIIEIIED